jgi:hypothetical protein
LSFAFYLFFAIIALLILLFAWSLRSTKKSAAPVLPPSVQQNTHGSSIGHLPQIRQALAREDEEFLARAGGKLLLRRLKKERRHVALSYLRALREDFGGLLRTAKIIAALSPEIGVGQEFERLRLTAIFLWRYRMAQLALYTGYAPLPEMAALSNFISGFTVRLEEAVKAMGERAALAAEMMSPSDRSRIHLT